METIKNHMVAWWFPLLVLAVTVALPLYMRRYGIATLGIFFATTPLFIQELKKRDLFYRFFDNNRPLLVMFTLFSLTFVVSVSGSIIPTVFQSLPESMQLGGKEYTFSVLLSKVIIPTLDQAGILFLFFSFFLFVLTFVVERLFLPSIQGYRILPEGQKVSTLTGETCISLRSVTALKLIEELGSVENAGQAIGEEFGRNLYEVHRPRDVDDFLNLWAETDRQAGLVGMLEIDKNRTSDKVRVVLFWSHFLRQKKPDPHSHVCKFFAAYIRGMIHSFNRLSLSHLGKKNYYVVSRDDGKCEKCSQKPSSRCTFRISLPPPSKPFV